MHHHARRMGLALCGLALVVTPIGSVAAAPSQLTATQQRDLLAMTREEKLARDVYLALDERYPTMLPFGQIARSEAQHLATMRQMLDRYGIDDARIDAVAASLGLASDGAGGR